MNELQESIKPAVFLDRDGTVCEEVGYLKDSQKLHLIRGSAEAIRIINHHGWKVVIISNQSGIARGYMNEAEVEAVNDALLQKLNRQKAYVDRIYYCPHHPQGSPPYNISCDCRKPASGMLLRAAEELKLDLKNSLVIGDKLTDVETANRLQISGILVLTGFGEGESKSMHNPVLSKKPVYIAKNLLDAIRWWFSRNNNKLL
jgi:D-glycero-D-manno-heptose 1,7-bisphosphate phosphatase